MERVGLVYAWRQERRGFHAGWTNRGDEEGDGDCLLGLRHGCDCGNGFVGLGSEIN